MCTGSGFAMFYKCKHSLLLKIINPIIKGKNFCLKKDIQIYKKIGYYLLFGRYSSFSSVFLLLDHPASLSTA
jgi:hypothetical protein